MGRAQGRGTVGRPRPARMKGVFHEIVEPERLVLSTGAFEDEAGTPQLDVLTTVTFADPHGKTMLTLRVAMSG